uniref:CYP3117C1 n=1 Tax=Locusta migratoria TaxID=7004 RepID=A0A6F8H0T3_LOCMI|nr:CYP3117C1 [Locusta migratoria]AVL92823.1 CYP450 [Locusta migratoria]
MSVWLVFGAALATVCACALAVASWLWATRLQTAAPGPPTWPLLGNVQHFLKQPVLLEHAADLYKQYGDVFRFYVGPKLVVVVTKPEDVKRVLVTTKWQERDPYFLGTLRKVTGNGLLINSGEVWQRHRKALEPTFHYTALHRYLDTFNKEVCLLSERLAAMGGQESDVLPLMCLSSLRITMCALGGMEYDVVEPDQYQQQQLASEFIGFLKVFQATMFRPWKAINSLMWMSEDGRKLKKIIGMAKDVTNRYLAALRVYNTKLEITSHFSSLLLEEKPEMQEMDDKISDEVVTVAVTATETMAGALAYALSALGLYPEWQVKAQQQLDEVFGEGGDFLRPATLEDIGKLTVIDAIVKETLRLFTVVPFLPRIIDEDIPLAGGRYVAPRGCCVAVASFLTHRDPDLYPEPDKFDPGRFLPGGSATSRKPFSYIPFGAGSRVCLGSSFATLEMKVTLATLLRQFTVVSGSTRKDLEHTLFSITAHPLKGFRLSFRARKEQSL